ncbi:MAG: site-specific integrase [Candidatus Eremiobacteraeota bacterium]|nr:site-specific integrase [Candidatus Eremiobacteraeota bacterium]MBC5826574.1 site-specific integrase [Candidatus Eremiobacteraeota bacterium]
MERRRRGNFEGSIFQRKSSGLWGAALVVGHDPFGKPRRRYVYCKTKQGVLDRLQRLKTEARAGVLNSNRQTVAAFLTRWLEDCARPAVRIGTYRLYEGLLRLHIIPRIGSLRLDRLTPLHLQAMQSDLERQGKSARLREQIHNLLHGAFDRAVRWRMIFSNPVDALEKARVPRRSMRALSADEAQRLLDAAKGSKFYALYKLALTTGMRQGEILALRWSDVDLEARSLSVRHTLLSDRGTPILAEPKTAHSRRKIELGADTVAALREHRLALFSRGLRASEWVFPDSKGGPMRKDNLVRDSFWPLLKAAGLPRIRFHDLRHTAASILLAHGTHPKIVQELLGHSKMALTMDTYSHAIPTLQREAADKLDSLFR